MYEIAGVEYNSIKDMVDELQVGQHVRTKISKKVMVPCYFKFLFCEMKPLRTAQTNLRLLYQPFQSSKAGLLQYEVAYRRRRVQCMWAIGKGAVQRTTRA